MFTEPVIDLVEVDPLLKRFGLTLMTGADKLGFKIDDVFEAARLMRLPGTHNWKPGLDGPFVSWKDHGHRYSPADFAEVLLPLPPRGSGISSRVSSREPVTASSRRRVSNVPPRGDERPWERFDRHVGARGVLLLLEKDLPGTFSEVGQDADGTLEFHYSRSSHTNSVAITADDKLIVWSDTLVKDLVELSVEEVRSPNEVDITTQRPYRPNEFWTWVVFKGSWSEAALWFAQEFPKTTGPDESDDREVLPRPKDPMAVARILLEDYRDDKTGALVLRHWRGDWMRWDGQAWSEDEDSTVRSWLYHRLEHACYQEGTGDKAPLLDWAPDRRKVGDLLETLAAQAHLPPKVQPPTWLSRDAMTTGTLACTNGLLDISTGQLYPHTPFYFNQVSLPFGYQADAPEPALWLGFLAELWPDDPESRALLQQWFGYVLSGRTDQQKVLGLLGPVRSGKGTICRVLRDLVGPGNVCAPTLSSFGQNFGLQPLIGKTVAIIGDVRLGGRESHAVVERLLSISGEDPITVDRKYRDPWTGQLPTRIMFLSNELPRFGDASGAIATRCVVLETRKSWLGREDPCLTTKLLTELPGILKWSLEGLAELDQRGRFIEPQSSRDAVTALADLVSPTSAFVRECCTKGQLEEVDVKTLYWAWNSWAAANNQRMVSTQMFGRNLRSVIPGLRVTRPRLGPEDSQVRVYRGISLKAQVPNL